jgi:Na+/citrate or Na+/malate symporter
LCRQGYPRLTGEGRLQPGDDDELQREEGAGGRVDVATVGAAVVTAVTLYLIGALGQREFGFPAPVAMPVIAVALKLTRGVSSSLQIGAFHVYKFFSTAVTYPLLFAIGIALTPWVSWAGRKCIRSIPRSLPPATADRAAAATSPSSAAMQLMPFAQIATRIGDAITVTVVPIVLTQIG